MPYPELKAILTDIGTEELSHLEMVGTIVYQLTRNLTPQQIKEAGFDTYFVDHTTGVYPVAASGAPFNADMFAVTGDTDVYKRQILYSPVSIASCSPVPPEEVV